MLGSLLQRDDIPALKALLAEYPDEWSVYWLYTRALLAYREGLVSAPGTLKLLKDARSANQHVPGILAGTAPPVVSSTGYITVGGADEATRAAWRKASGAVEWLATAISARPIKRPARKTPN